MKDIKKNAGSSSVLCAVTCCTLFPILLNSVAKCLALRADAAYVGRRSRALGEVYVHLTLLMESAVSWGKETTSLCVFLAGC
jgi:hypothetical protein